MTAAWVSVASAAHKLVTRHDHGNMTPAEQAEVEIDPYEEMPKCEQMIGQIGIELCDD